MSDSDETFASDSRNELNYSPDLFDGENDKTNKPANTEQIRMRGHQSKAHAMSDSDSDEDTKVTHKHKPNVGEKVNKGAERNAEQCDKIKNRHKFIDRGNKVNQSAETNSYTPKSEQKDKTKDRKEFIKDFLGMFDSDSDEDRSKTTARKHDEKGKPKTEHNNRTTPKSEEKSKTFHQREADINKYSTPKSDIKHKTFKPIKEEANTSLTSKPYKIDYSKPYSDSKMSSVKNTSISDENRTKTSDSAKHKQACSEQIHKRTTVQESPSAKNFESGKHKGNGFNDIHKRPSITVDKESSNASSALKRKHSQSPVLHELRKAATEILKTTSPQGSDKPMCKYGSGCYRKNPSHLEEFSHPAKKRSSLSSSFTSDSPQPSKKQKLSMETPSTSRQNISERKSSPSPIVKKDEKVDRPRSPPKTPKTFCEKFRQAHPYSFFLTKVTGIDDKFNSSYAMDIKDILSPDMGNLTSSCQFNFMFEIPWLMKQYPPAFRSKPLLIVHGEQGPSKAKLQGDAYAYTNIKFCQAKLEMMYGTHHTKMMILLYDNGMRVVIHTSNLIENDWYKKTQGMWISEIFPRLASPSKEKGESPSYFKRDLMNYIAAYKAYQLKEWIEHIERHDMSSARVVIVGSVPGRHQGDSEMSKWGHMKLRKVLKQHGPDPSTVKSWPVIGQFSSIGSMGPNKDNWVCGEFQQSLATTKASSGLQSNVRLQLIFPSKDNVRLSLEGFPAGGSIPYTVKTAKKQPYLHDFFHVWMSEGRGRSKAMPHIKTYIRPKQDGSMAAWFCVTSANLSKAAWGAFEKKGAQLMIRSYEIGVLMLPKFFDGGDTFGITSDIDTARTSQKLILPYDLPTHKYEKKDRPWMWDIPYMDLPDTNGNIWCPFSK